MSLVIHCEQGSPEWFRLRCGLPTASRFDMLITPKGKPSESASRLRNECLAEWLLGEPLSDDVSQFMQRGSSLEQGAIDYYELVKEVDVQRVGFIMSDDRRTGCSPDGLVGEDGGLELKCPSAAVHVGYLLDGPGDRYRAQIQGCLWLSGRSHWDFLSYHPTLPPVLLRIERDEVFIAALAAAVDQFCDRLDAAKAELLARGVTPVASPAETPA